MNVYIRILIIRMDALAVGFRAEILVETPESGASICAEQQARTGSLRCSRAPSSETVALRSYERFAHVTGYVTAMAIRNRP